MQRDVSQGTTLRVVMVDSGKAAAETKQDAKGPQQISPLLAALFKDGQDNKTPGNIVPSGSGIPG
eukprot:scaffold370321_cov22-Prasinocladus_malaysianus.AAC.1